MHYRYHSNDIHDTTDPHTSPSLRCFLLKISIVFDHSYNSIMVYTGNWKPTCSLANTSKLLVTPFSRASILYYTVQLSGFHVSFFNRTKANDILHVTWRLGSEIRTLVYTYFEILRCIRWFSYLYVYACHYYTLLVLLGLHFFLSIYCTIVISLLRFYIVSTDFA